MPAKFFNKAISDGLRVALNILDQKEGPSLLHTGEVQPIIDVLAAKKENQAPAAIPATPNFGYGKVIDLGTGGIKSRSVASLLHGTMDLVGSTVGVGFPLPTILPTGIYPSYRFDALKMELVLDSAGALAMNNKVLGFALHVLGPGDPGNTNTSLIYMNCMQVFATGKFHYNWTMWQNSQGMPQSSAGASQWNGGFRCQDDSMQSQGLALYLDTWIDDFNGSTAFPANTVLNVSGIVRQSLNGSVPLIL